VTGFGIIAGQLANASGANPLLRPSVFSALALRSQATQTLAAQNAALAKTQAAIPAARAQFAALAAAFTARDRVASAPLAAVQSAAAALTAAQAAQDSAAAELKNGNLDLIKWRAAEARLATDPQYAAQQTNPK
jgi:hypothetical protein